MAPAGWEGSPGRLAFFLRNAGRGNKVGDGGDGDEKKRANVWWCGDLFVSLRRGLQPKMAADKNTGGAMPSRQTGHGEGGQGWLLTRTREARWHRAKRDMERAVKDGCDMDYENE